MQTDIPAPVQVSYAVDSSARMIQYNPENERFDDRLAEKLTRRERKELKQLTTRGSSHRARAQHQQPSSTTVSYNTSYETLIWRFSLPKKERSLDYLLLYLASEITAPFDE